MKTVQIKSIFRQIGRLTEPRAAIERLLAKARSFTNLPVFLDLNGRPRNHKNWDILGIKFRAGKPKKIKKVDIFEI